MMASSQCLAGSQHNGIPQPSWGFPGARELDHPWEFGRHPDERSCRSRDGRGAPGLRRS